MAEGKVFWSCCLFGRACRQIFFQDQHLQTNRVFSKVSHLTTLRLVGDSRYADQTSAEVSSFALFMPLPARRLALLEEPDFS